MTTLLLELPPELYERLYREAEEVGDTVQVTAQRLLQQSLGLDRSRPSDVTQIRAALQAAGLLTVPGPEMQARARQSTARLEDVQASFDTTEGKPLSEIIIEMRGPKQ